MTNNKDYLFCEMKNNAFTVFTNAIINEVQYTFSCKIDTGCSHTVIPYKSIGNFTNRQSRKAKMNAINNKLHYVRSYGVSDTDFTKFKDKLLLRLGMISKCKSVKFLHRNINMSLNNFSFTSDVYVNYDRTNKALIGMDTLQSFLFVCDVSKITGKFTLIACPRAQKDKSNFYSAVKTHFGLTTIK